MARFIAKIKDKISKGKIDPLEVDRDAISLGTQMDCTLHFEDPLAGDRHAEISHESGGFILTDLGSAIGTFVNGDAVVSPRALADGDEIVIGLTRLQVEVGEKGGEPALTLTGDIGGFGFEAADLDLWVRDEVAFGRYSPVRIGNWFMVFGLIALVPILFFDAVEEPLFDPGHLVQAHAQLFDATPEVRELFPEETRLADEQGCMVCHDSLNRTPLQSCANCHRDLMVEHHPFREEERADTGASDRGYQEHDCLLCHVEHRGELAALVPPSESTPDTCQTCHASGVPSEILHELLGDNLEREQPLPYESFPHSRHGELECGACHVRQDAETGGGREFQTVSYETCAECHVADARPQDPVLAEIRANLDPRHIFRVDWHGSEDAIRCTACHDQPLQEGQLRRVPVQRTSTRPWNLARREHAELFGQEHPTMPDGFTCDSCHADGAPDFRTDPARGMAQDRTFFHGLHLARMTVDENASRAETEATCTICHEELALDARLSGGLKEERYQGPSTGSCAECHRVEPGDDSLIEGPGRLTWVQAPDRIDFPHGLHVGSDDPLLSTGCYACHDFDSSGDAPLFSALAATKEGARDCTLCHVAAPDDMGSRVVHRAIGGGGCTLCHRAEDTAYEHGTKPWPVYSRFDHFSPGHVDETEMGNCAACHDESSTLSADRVSDVPLPTESSSLCRDCHVDERARFHWR